MAFAGPDGMVEFRGLPPGKVTVVAWRAEAKPAKLEATVTPGQAFQTSVVVP